MASEMTDESGIMSTAQRIAKIESTFLGWEDHGILTCMLHVSYGHSGQGVGGYALDTPISNVDHKTKRFGTAYGMEFVRRVMRACGVEQWEKLAGRTIYVLADGDDWNAKIIGIENLPTERGERFLFSELDHYEDRLAAKSGLV